MLSGRVSVLLMRNCPFENAIRKPLHSVNGRRMEGTGSGRQRKQASSGKYQAHLTPAAYMAELLYPHREFCFFFFV